jgi:hypothetical protein
MWVIVERWYPDERLRFKEERRPGKFATQETAQAHADALMPNHEGGQFHAIPESAQSSKAKQRGTKLRPHRRQPRH